jgi:hypothetical protein
MGSKGKKLKIPLHPSTQKEKKSGSMRIAGNSSFQNCG